MSRTPLHIGIVACSAEGAALCYRTICTEAPALMGAAHAHPEVSLHGLSLADQMAPIYEGDWAAVAEMMLISARKLASIGADVLICPDNTIHQALPYVLPTSPLPWLHIAEVVASEAAQRGFKRIGLTGTRWLVESEVYPRALEAAGLAFVRPPAPEREEMNRVIMDELVCGELGPQQAATFQRVIEGLKGQGCDSVVLGCTEIPLVISDANAVLPTLDSTRLLARAALKHALAE